MTIQPRKSMFFVPMCAAVLAASLAFAAHAAITPTLALNNVGNNEVQVTVTGDPNAAVSLYYYTGYLSQATNIGTIGYTASNEYFSTTLLSGQYNIPSNASVYVMVDGVASAPVNWPYVNGTGYTNYSSITFSPSSVSLAPSQTATVTLYGGSGQYYVTQNSSLVTTNISGSTLNLYGVTDGSGSITVCSGNTGYTSNNSCGTLYITVTGVSNGYTYPTTYPTYPTTYPYSSYPTYSAYQPVQPLSLNQSAIDMTVGQQESIGIYGSGQGYFIYNNSNPSAVTATMSGNAVVLNGIAPGISYLMVCESVGSSCAAMFVNVSQPITYVQPPVYYYQQPQPIYYPQPQPIYQQVFRPVSYIFQPVARYFSYMNPMNW